MGAGTQPFGPSSADFQGLYQGAGCEEQPGGLKSTSLGDLGTTGNGFIYYIKSVSFQKLLSKSNVHQSLRTLS